MQYHELKIPGLWLGKPKTWKDSRGYFRETWRRTEMQPFSMDDFCQMNESSSTYGVVRGLHYQENPHAQGKWVRVPWGRILDVVVDIRWGSPTFGHVETIRLSHENGFALWIPRGCAHGFATFSDVAILSYACDQYYAPDAARTILWNDPALGIDWQIPTQSVILSRADQKGQMWHDYCQKVAFYYE